MNKLHLHAIHGSEVEAVLLRKYNEEGIVTKRTASKRARLIVRNLAFDATDVSDNKVLWRERGERGSEEEKMKERKSHGRG